MSWFNPSTSIAVLDIPGDRVAYLEPPIIAGHQFVGGCSSGVTGCRVIMAGFQNSELYDRVVWYVQKDIDIDQVIFFELAFS